MCCRTQKTQPIAATTTPAEGCSPLAAKAFTLIELLGGITVIALLAALLFPFLGKARESAQKAACAANLRSVGVALNQYASEHDGWTPKIFDFAYGRGWCSALVEEGYMPPMAQGRPHPLICPSQKPKLYKDDPGAMSYCYGMRNVSYAAWRINLGDARESEHNGAVIWGPPSKFLIVGDTVLNLPGDAGDRHQRYFFDAGGAGGANSVHLRHNKRGNFLFADGHVESLSKVELLGGYGATDLDAPSAPYNPFVAGAIDESPAE